MTKGFTLRLIPALMMCGFAGVAGASGFQLQNQNGSGTGLAYAGAAAAAEDASTIFFNPAGMTYLPEGHSVSMALTALNRSVEFTDTGTTANPTGGALGSNGGNAGGLSYIPAGYYSYSISPALRIGLGISPTYGSETRYSDDFMGRYSAIANSIRQININPSIAYKLNDRVSLGFGLNYAMNHIEVVQKAAAAGSPQGKLEGGDNAWGFNVGALFQVSPSTRIGVHYRSSIKFMIDGHQKVDGAGIDRDINGKLNTPDTFSIAVSQKLSDRWEMLGDLTRTGWSSVQYLEPIINATGARASQPLRYNFENTWRVGLGAKYQYSAPLSLRFGVAYDQSPVPNAESRNLTLPDSDRVWLSFGARYAVTKASSIDFGYAHIFFKDSSTAKQVTNAAETVVAQTVRGNFKTSADILSVQYNHTF